MVSERLSDSEINRLRGVVGLGTSGGPEFRPTAPEKQEKPEIRETRPPVKSVNLNNIIKPQERQPAQVHKTLVETELFVKIDEHTEVAKELIDAKKEIKSIADTMSLLGRAESLKAEAIERLEAHLNNLDGMLSDVEEKLTAPEGLDMGEIGVDVESSSEISDLHRTLERLKDELSHIK